MPKNKQRKLKPDRELPDTEAIKRLFPKEVLEEIRRIVKASEKKAHK